VLKPPCLHSLPSSLLWNNHGKCHGLLGPADALTRGRQGDREGIAPREGLTSHFSISESLS